MLVLARKASQTIQIGKDVTLTVLGVSGNTVRLGIDAPKEVPVLRGELCHQDTHSLVMNDKTAPLAKYPTRGPGLEIALLNVPASVIRVP